MSSIGLSWTGQLLRKLGRYAVDLEVYKASLEHVNLALCSIMGIWNKANRANYGFANIFATLKMDNYLKWLSRIK